MGLTQSNVVVHGKTVETSSGTVRGRVYEAEGGREVDAFLGVPFAEPPTGELRFKKPVPKRRWEGVLDCFHFGPRCPQTDEYFSGFLNIVGKDEGKCLTLNVFAPRWKSEQFPSGMPVMVWIHGGGFAMHSSSNYGDRTIARNLCSKDVVVVSINYRLGPFGFFCTGDDRCKGNLGLWDQTLALEWVRDNAAAFGGDSSNVTVFGQSAGGVSADLLSLSPHSRDLFHKSISMAGSAECDFAIRSNERQTELSFKYAKFLGWKPHDEKSSEELYEWMHSQSAALLEIGISGKKGFECAGELIFSPNYDGDFFPRPLAELRREVEGPRKPRLAGVTLNEGLFFAAMAGVPRTVDGLEKFLSEMLTKENYEESDELRKQVVDFYLRGVDPKDKRAMTECFVKLFGDVVINVGLWEMARREAELGAQVYLYSFNYFNPNGFGLVKWMLPFLGATHCYEIRYVLGKGIISKFKPNDDDKKMIEVMTNYFTNFAKHGNPNGADGHGEWEPLRADRADRHLAIELRPEMRDAFLEGRPAFWTPFRNAKRGKANL